MTPGDASPPPPADPGMREMPCLFCGVHEERLRFRDEPYRVVECRRCGLVYVNPRPDGPTLGRMYDDPDYYTHGYNLGVETENYFERKDELLAQYDGEVEVLEGEVGGRGRLLEHGQPDVPGGAPEALRLVGSIALVGVEAELDPGTHGRAHRAHTRDVPLHVQPPLELERPEALFDESQGSPDGLVLGQHEEGHAGGDVGAEAPQHAPDGEARPLAQQIVQGHVHGRARRGGGGEELGHALGEAGASQRVLALERRGRELPQDVQAVGQGLAGDGGLGRGDAQPHVRAVGDQAQHHVGGAVHGLGGQHVGLAQGERQGLDLSLHEEQGYILAD